MNFNQLVYSAGMPQILKRDINQDRDVDGLDLTAVAVGQSCFSLDVIAMDFGKTQHLWPRSVRTWFMNMLILFLKIRLILKTKNVKWKG